MRARTLETLFHAVLLLASTTGGSCSGTCEDVPAQTFTKPLRAATDDAGGPDLSLLEPDGTITPVHCTAICDGPYPEPGYTDPSVTCEKTTGDAGEIAVTCHKAPTKVCPNGGRGHADVDPGQLSPTDVVADYLAGGAVLEASSVLAFRRLRRELRRHGARRSLLRSLSRAARDETRHARVMERLARREGSGRMSAPSQRAFRPRALEAIAIENAVEGCVFETYGALLAIWQGENAAGTELRGALRRIARDETRHAALAWTIARWADQKLDRAARERVLAARRSAVAELRRRVVAHDPELVERGLQPDARTALRMVDELLGGLDCR